MLDRYSSSVSIIMCVLKVIGMGVFSDVIVSSIVFYMLRLNIIVLMVSYKCWCWDFCSMMCLEIFSVV